MKIEKPNVDIIILDSDDIITASQTCNFDATQCNDGHTGGGTTCNGSDPQCTDGITV